MKNFKIIIALMGAWVLLFSCGNNASSSANLGKSTSEQTTSTEGEVKIGTQTWATKNLDVSTFRNGDTIPEAKTNEEWIAAGDSGKPAWCYYDNDPENGKKYGKLYNWFAVNDPRGLAPKGWHVSSDTEWETLTDNLGGVFVAMTKMKSTNGWNDKDGKSGNGTNESGFLGLPGGVRLKDGKFYAIGDQGTWWSSSEDTFGTAWYRDLYSPDGWINRDFSRNKQEGQSVRCLRD